MRRKSSSKKESGSWKCWARKNKYFEIQGDDMKRFHNDIGKGSWPNLSGLLPTLVNKLILKL